MHSLYDLGFIGVNDNSSLIVSEWISKVSIKNLGIQNNWSAASQIAYYLYLDIVNLLLYLLEIFAEG